MPATAIAFLLVPHLADLVGDECAEQRPSHRAAGDHCTGRRRRRRSRRGRDRRHSTMRTNVRIPSRYSIVVAVRPGESCCVISRSGGGSSSGAISFASRRPLNTRYWRTSCRALRSADDVVVASVHDQQRDRQRAAGRGVARGRADLFGPSYRRAVREHPHRGHRPRRRSAGNGGKCAATPAKSFGWRSPSTAARQPPADIPATNIRRGCTRYARRTARICAAMIAASPRPALVALSNQFQQVQAFALLDCRGSRTSHPLLSASAVIRVAAAKSSARLPAAVQQYQQRPPPPAAVCAGHVDQVFARRPQPGRDRQPAAPRQFAVGDETAGLGRLPPDQARSPFARGGPEFGYHRRDCGATRCASALVHTRSARCRTAPACRSTRPAAKSACR